MNRGAADPVRLGRRCRRRHTARPMYSAEQVLLCLCVAACWSPENDEESALSYALVSRRAERRSRVKDFILQVLLWIPFTGLRKGFARSAALDLGGSFRNGRVFRYPPGAGGPHLRNTAISAAIALTSTRSDRGSPQVGSNPNWAPGFPLRGRDYADLREKWQARKLARGLLRVRSQL